MTSIQYIIQSMDDLFMDYEWNLITNEKNKFSYVSNIYPLDFFSIKYNDTKDNIMVTIPLNKSKFYYTTCFTNYEQALHYLLHHFKYFIHNK